jgi:PPOX class probable FMN-dependent enzyme
MEQFEQLKEQLGPPGKLAANKARPGLDDHSRDYIEKSPFVMIATSDAEGHCDVSPRGDAPGFVQILDDTHLFIPERPGNRRMDSIHNLITNAHIGLIFIIPGLEETFRVNGKACITCDPELLKLSAVGGKLPLMGIGVEIEECYLHCAKAFKRSGLWQANSWLPTEQRPSVARLLAAHISVSFPVSAEEVDEQLQESYTKRLY